MALAVSAGLAAVVSGLFGVLIIFPLLWTAASVTAVVLLFTGRAGEWFRVHPEIPPPTPGAIIEL